MSNARLTDRDSRILVRLAVARWLTTTQIQRTYFPGATLNAVQKRLRRLSDAGYVRSYREHPTAEAIHSVGPKSRPLLEERGIEAATDEQVPRQLEHLLGINELRVAVETSSAQVSWFFAYWQLANLGWRHPAIPDAVFAVRNPEQRVFLTEFDRGTETVVGKLVQKLRSYDAGIEGFSFEAVLIVMEGKRCLDLISRTLRKEGLRLVVLVASLEDVKKGGSLFDVVFTELPEHSMRTLLGSVDAAKT